MQLVYILHILERIPAKRTSILVTRRKPLEQTIRVEQVLAGHASLIGDLLGRTNNRIADGTFRMTIQGSSNILAESHKAICNASILE